ncbi:hypothetical protein evm_010051 [Chilo suppressalis]|nr:hypothetical protein evm_010051 [Chilo suppressalis]
MLRSRAKVMIENCFNLYISNIESDLTTNIKSFWRYVKSKNVTNTIPSSMYFQDRIATAGDEIVNLFAEFFASVHKHFHSAAAFTEPEFFLHSYCLSQVQVTADLVLTRFRNVDLSKGAGPEGISSIFIRLCASALPLNVPTAGAQAFPMDGIGRLGHDPPRGPSADWRVLTTADATRTNGLTCLSKHGGTPCCLTITIAAKYISQKSIMKVFVLFGVLFVSAMAAAMPAEVAPPPETYNTENWPWAMRTTIQNDITAVWTHTFPLDHQITSVKLTHIAGIATVELVSGGEGFNWISIRVIQPNFFGPVYMYRLEVLGYRSFTESTSQELTATKLTSDGEENIFYYDVKL